MEFKIRNRTFKIKLVDRTPSTLYIEVFFNYKVRTITLTVFTLEFETWNSSIRGRVTN